MYYNLTQKTNRRRFIKYANFLLEKQKSCVLLVDESGRTPNQNSYIHVLCRIVAMETGVTELYAKQIYFKELANPGIFVTSTKDDIAGHIVKVVRSSSDLSVTEMSRAIDGFITWAAENGISLPKAKIKDDGTLEFVSETDKKAFEAAKIATSQAEKYI